VYQVLSLVFSLFFIQIKFSKTSFLVQAKKTFFSKFKNQKPQRLVFPSGKEGSQDLWIIHYESIRTKYFFKD